MFAGRVRALAAADAPAWRALWAGYLAFYETALPEDVTDTAFARLTGPDDDLFGFVAEQDGRLVGIVHCVLHRSTWARGSYLYINDLFVAPDARGTGAGRALIAHVYAHADAIGAERVYWLTHETNATARKLYDSLAFNDGFLEYRR